MARNINSGMNSFSESDFTDSYSDSDAIDPVEDSSCRDAKFDALRHRSSGDSLSEPKVGMVFRSEEEAYEFYNEYAKKKGFSVRKGHIARRSDGSVQSRSYLCSKEGTRQKHNAHATRKPRALERTNCMARIEYKVDRENRWLVSKVILDHNHLLASASTSHMLKSQRKGLHSKTRVSDELDRVGVQAFEVVDGQGGEGHATENVGFVRRYQSRSLSTNRTRDLEKGDAQILFEFLKAKQSEDPSFFYAIQLDEMDRMTNFFWTDTRSVIKYSYFGDVVSLDTTYRLNKSDIPFSPFTGVNHHKQIVVFGASVLLDESTESFIWLLNTFLVAMSGRQPRTIFTEHCSSIANAISIVLPNTCHRICLWHIFQNADKQLSSIYSSKPNFSKEFKSCLYEAGSEEDFYAAWNNLISKFDLSGNPWLQDLFAVRERWALVYQRNSFSAVITTMQWSESMTNLFKMYFNRKLPLSRFIELYHKALIQLHEKELSEDYKSRTTKPVLLVDMPMLNEAAESYTRLVYMDFEDQFKSQIACLCEPVATDGTIYTFKVSLPNESCYWLVELNPTDVIVTCSCKKFESMGILCMHALKVLNNNNILNLPVQYILKRWTKFANEGVTDFEDQETLSLRYSQLCHKMIATVAKTVVYKDALEIFERGFAKLVSEVDNVIHGPPKVVESRGQTDCVNATADRKRKRKIQDVNSTEKNASTDRTQSKGQDANGHDQILVNELSHVRNFDQKGAMTPHDVGPVYPTGVSGDTAPLGMVTTSQGNVENATTLQGANDARIAAKVMRGQAANINNCTVETYPNVVVYRFHCDQPMRFTVPSKRTHKISLDTSKEMVRMETMIAFAEAVEQILNVKTTFCFESVSGTQELLNTWEGMPKYHVNRSLSTHFMTKANSSASGCGFGLNCRKWICDMEKDAGKELHHSHQSHQIP